MNAESATVPFRLVGRQILERHLDHFHPFLLEDQASQARLWFPATLVPLSQVGVVLQVLAENRIQNEKLKLVVEKLQDVWPCKHQKVRKHIKTCMQVNFLRKSYLISKFC